jgi:hypothetical protein
MDESSGAGLLAPVIILYRKVLSMSKKVIPVFSIVMYVLAGMLLLYSVWGAIYCVNYLSSYFMSGQLTFAGNEFDVINFHVSTYGQYVLFAVVLFMLGWILHSIQPEVLVEEVEEEVEAEVEEIGED